ncbi:phosphatidylserine decarboxylase [Candidatus Latescibacterota bacterium]
MLRIDSDGYRILSVLCVFSLLGAGIYYIARWELLLYLTGLFCVLAIFSLSFFRDPERTGPDERDAAVSAADGVVVDISTVRTDDLGDREILRIAIFMNIFNVHVNRSPLDGRVVRIKHRNGKKLSAFNKRAEYENEHGDTDIETAWGLVRIRQIAGLLARRVVTRVKEGDMLNRGDRLGIIRFGSRVDVFFPKAFKPAVTKGDHVIAGETIIARPVLNENCE